MDDTSGYNGWKNYPTWNVNLWLNNDQGTYEATQELVADAIEFATSKNGWLEHNTPRLAVADALQEWVVSELAPDLGASFAADLLGYALDEVDWLEIADAWIENAAEVEA